MKHVFARRLGVLTLGSALAVGALAPAAHADATPSSASAGTWLQGQLTDGVVHNDQYDFDDFALTVDVALGLRAGGDPAAARAIADRLDDPSAMADYIGDIYDISLAGSLGKAAVLAFQNGEDAHDFGGEDLIGRLEGQVMESGANEGRIYNLPRSSSDSANVVGQAFAASALTAAGSDRAEAATSFLLQQQCSDGYFRTFFSPADGDAQTCDASDAEPSVDTTALVVALLATAPGADTAAAVQRAATWLAGQQAADGSFGGGTGTADANTNSTGLAGAALGLVCQTTAAVRSADFVRTLQVGPAQIGTELDADQGAVAYDAAALSSGSAQGITVETQDQFRRATAQAIGGLVWDASADATVALSGPSAVPAGSAQTLTITGASVGETVCLTTPTGVRRLVGTGAPLVVPVTAPSSASGSATYSATTGPGSSSFNLVAAAASPSSAPGAVPGAASAAHPAAVLTTKKVSAGDKVKVKVSGLAPGTKVVTKLRGTKVDKTRTGAKGVATVRFTLKGKVAKPGKTKLKIKPAGEKPVKVTLRITQP